jgi:uncharacterized delta-60 repeat protein
MAIKASSVTLAVAAALVLLVGGCGGGDGDGSHSPGSLDSTFDPGTNLGDWVNRIVVQPDGKILAGGGQYETVNGSVTTPASGDLARLNENGSLDGSFSGWTGVNAKIESIALQGDGKILIGGQFTIVDGASRSRFARLNADGSLDSGFAVGTGTNGGVNAIVVNADGTIMIAGSFTTYAGSTAKYLARLSANGSLDATYHPTGTGFDGSVSYLAPAAGGGFFAAGSFLNYDGASRAKIAKLGAEGGLDGAFVPAALGSGGYTGIAPRPDGSLVVAGSFTTLGGLSRARIARLTATGTVDAAFDPGSGVEGNSSPAYGLTMQSDGKVLVGGYFNHYDGVAQYGTARINEDGSLDSAFATDPTWQNGVDTKLCFAIQADGKILMGGNFSVCGGKGRRYLARVWP